MIRRRQLLQLFIASFILFLSVGFSPGYAENENSDLHEKAEFDVYLLLGNAGMAKAAEAGGRMEPM